MSRLAGERYLLAPGQELAGEQTYWIQAYRGGGSFSAGYRATDTAGKDWFVKEFLPARHPSEREELRGIFLRECDVMRRLGSYELCPRFQEAFETCGYQYLVQEFIPGRDLDSLLEARTRFDVEVLVRWALCLCHALAFLHGRSVIHHDLKPSNIRMNADGDPVLLDFGAARWYRSADEKSDVLYGTEGYLAPEYAAGAAEDLAAGMRMDVFALGRILVEMLVGQRMTQAEIDQRHDQIYGSILHSKTLDISLVRAIFRSVSYNPTARYASAIEMEQDLVAAAPPIGRRRPAELDLGAVTDARPRESIVSVYTVGGGSHAGDVSTDVEWLEVGVTGAGTARKQAVRGNRQAVRVVAFPDRVPPGGAAQGRVILGFPAGYMATVITMRRPVDVSKVVAHPERVRLTVDAAQWARASFQVHNHGEARVGVRFEPPADPPLAVSPESLELAPGAKAEVTVAVDGATCGTESVEAALGWTADSVAKPPVWVEVRPKTKGGILAGVLRRGAKG